jgi:D-sedoheptulose 7-phosphate isomerase
VFIAITTSGNSPNLLLAASDARALDVSVIALTGPGGGKLGPLADICLAVPSTTGARIQECQLAIEHILCEIVEAELFWGPTDEGNGD